MHHKMATNFMNPVEWKKLGLFDYPKVITKPMWLKKVHLNCQQTCASTERYAFPSLRSSKRRAARSISNPPVRRMDIATPSEQHRPKQMQRCPPL